VETIRYAAYDYLSAAQDADGHWSAGAVDATYEGEWGTLRIVTGSTWDTTGTATLGSAGTDITLINSVPTVVDALTFGEPYGELTGQLTLPELAPFDDLAAIQAQPGNNVDIYRVLPAALATAAGTAEVPYWHGIIASSEWSDGPGIQTAVSLQLTGALYGEASVRQHQPLMLDTAYDVGSWAGRALDPVLYDRPFTPFTRFTFDAATTGIDVRYRGSRGQSTIDYLDELLALAQDPTYQWTISRAYRTYGTLNAPRPRHYYLRAKSETLAGAVQQNTVFMGGYGIGVSLSRDVTETPNAIYGEGVHPVGTSELSGSRWRNAVYPMLAGTVPTYPDRVGTATDYPITTGDTDGLFTTDVITQITAQLRLGGYPDVTIGTVFTSTVGSAIVDWKQDIDYANTNANIGGTAEWAKLFESGTGYTDLSSGWFKPLAWDRAVAKWVYTASGDVAGTAVQYDPSVLRVESTISYGENVPKKRARINARRIVNTGTAPTIGTITLASDPVDETPAGRSRLDVREGGWVRLINYPGSASTDFYIAGVTHSPEAFTTTLTVSTEAFDLLDLSTRLERNRSAKSDPAKSFYSQRTSTTRPFRSAVGWDAESGAGTVPRFAAAGSAWTVQRFIGAQYGQIGALRVDTAPDTGYCFAVFGGSVSPEFLDGLVAAPLGSVTGGYPSWWQHPDKLDALGTAGFIEAWGSLGEAAGYYPGAESIGAGTAAGSVTGALEDAGSWSFASYEPPWLWAAIWPRASVTKVAADMRIIQDEG
jgi:hypothetical protein